MSKWAEQTRSYKAIQKWIQWHFCYAVEEANKKRKRRIIKFNHFNHSKECISDDIDDVDGVALSRISFNPDIFYPHVSTRFDRFQKKKKEIRFKVNCSVLCYRHEPFCIHPSRPFLSLVLFDPFRSTPLHFNIVIFTHFFSGKRINKIFPFMCVPFSNVQAESSAVFRLGCSKI